MSTAELPKPMASKSLLVWHAIAQRRASIAWLASAGIVTVAAFACTTIQIRDSIFDATQLRLLIAALSSIATSNVLLAMNNHKERWHLASWVTVTAVWYLILALT